MRHGVINKKSFEYFLTNLKYANVPVKPTADEVLQIDEKPTKLFVQLAIESIKIKTNRARNTLTHDFSNEINISGGDLMHESLNKDNNISFGKLPKNTGYSKK